MGEYGVRWIVYKMCIVVEVFIGVESYIGFGLVCGGNWQKVDVVVRGGGVFQGYVCFVCLWIGQCCKCRLYNRVF